LVKYLGEGGNSVPNELCDRSAFISHHQKVASRTVLLLGEWIEKELEKRGYGHLKKVWIDKKERATSSAMKEGVRRSRNFILFLTKEVLTREYCLREIRDALKLRKNVILVYETNEEFGGVKGRFSDFYGPELMKVFHQEDYEWLIKRSYVEFHDRGQHVDVMLGDLKCRNGILDQMDLGGPVSPVRSRASVVCEECMCSARRRRRCVHVPSRRQVLSVPRFASLA
jgi:hypothetical protein